MEEMNSTELPDLGDQLRWHDERTILMGAIRLRLMRGMKATPSSERAITLFKDQEFVFEYVNLLKNHTVRSMIEVGVKHGGSALFFWHLLGLDKLCCIELADSAPQLEHYVRKNELGDAIHMHFGVDQADRETVLAHAEADFGGELVDVIVDDASHHYTPSKATLETLFPLLKPGGLYILEDWRASLLDVHTAKSETEKEPLHKLVHEMLEFSTIYPGIVSMVLCQKNFAVFKRGTAGFPETGFSL